jgi:hypothetical protein
VWVRRPSSQKLDLHLLSWICQDVPSGLTDAITGSRMWQAALLGRVRSGQVRDACDAGSLPKPEAASLATRRRRTTLRR